MKLEKRVLIIDNSSIFIQGVKYVIESYITCKCSINLCISHSYKNALKKLNYFADLEESVDLIFLNIDINSADTFGLILTKNYLKQIRYFNPGTKIVLFSNRKQAHRIQYIIKNSKPNGFILERDFNFKELIKIFNCCFKSEIYYSKSIRTIISNNKNHHNRIDEIDFHILYFLKQGLKSNYIQRYIPRTNSAIEKRKYKLKDELAFDKCSDEQLVKEAIKRGIL